MADNECSEEDRKKYSMRTERKTIYPKVQVKLRKRRLKKYELRQLNAPVSRYEELCRMKKDPENFMLARIDDTIEYGIFTLNNVNMNDVLLEYKGQLVTREESEHLHRLYERNGNGCYIVDFVHNEQKLSIDATLAEGTLGRFVNDSVQRYANCEMKKHVVDGVPHLFLVAKTFIKEYTELRYDYGDHTRNLHWRGCSEYEKPLELLTDVIPKWKAQQDKKLDAANNNIVNANAWNDNAGDDNAGDDNAGDDNAGDDNAWDDNAGNDNAGNDNAWDDNAGDDNAGDDKKRKRKEKENHMEDEDEKGDLTITGNANIIIVLSD